MQERSDRRAASCMQKELKLLKRQNVVLYYLRTFESADALTGTKNKSNMIEHQVKQLHAPKEQNALHFYKSNDVLVDVLMHLIPLIIIISETESRLPHRVPILLPFLHALQCNQHRHNPPASFLENIVCGWQTWTMRHCLVLPTRQSWWTGWDDRIRDDESA